MSTAQLVNQPQQERGIKAISKFLNGDSIKNKFQEVLGEGGPAFVSSLLTVVSQNEKLHQADQTSIYTSALMAATLKLPINSNLGFAYIIPFNDKKRGLVAQFQLGYKGFIQLAQRTGLYKNINSEVVKEGELIEHNRLTGEIKFNWEQDPIKRANLKTIGYVSFFKLNNGFESTLYMTKEDSTAHGKKYSQTFKNNFGLWVDDFDSMALKTVTKLNLSKNGPLSIDMQKALISDQSVIKSDSFVDDPETLDIIPEYIDNDSTNEKQVENKKEAVKKAKEEASLFDGKQNMP